MVFLLLLWNFVSVNLLLAGHGGEGEKKSIAMFCEAGGRLAGLFLLVLLLGTGWLSLRLSDELLRWEVGGGVAEAGSPFNKGSFGHLSILWRRAAKLFPAGRGGEGKKKSEVAPFRSGVWRGRGLGAATSGSDFSTVSSPSTFMAEGQLLPPLLLVTDGQRKVQNLQADVPCRRPSTPGAVCSHRFAPSGLLPGGVAVVRAWLKLGGDGAGSDCIVQVRSRVLLAICQDLSVIFFICMVLLICNSTDGY
jgi:hypothetical protein